MKKSQIVIACLMLLAASSSIAMSFGRHRGAALIGRPLDISVQATLDAQEDPAASCIDADVFFGDTKLSKARFQVNAEKAGNGQEAVIRIRSTSPVDEPVVTLYLRGGCLQKTEKKFVVLADLASEPAPVPSMAQMPAAAPRQSSAAPQTASPANVPAFSGQAATPDAAPPAPARRSRNRAPAASTQASQADAVPAVAGGRPASTAVVAPREGAPQATIRSQRAREARDAKAAAKGNARLKLEPLDLSIERDPTLRSSSEMLSSPSASPQERSAAAALWRALTSQPQDILRDAEKLQGLESSVRALQAQSQKNLLAIETLNGQVKKAESERYANLLVYALAALLLIALVALAYFVRGWMALRRGSESDLPWWRKNEPLEKGWASSAPDIDALSANADAHPPKKPVKGVKKGAPSASELDLDLGNDESGFTEVKHMSHLSNPDSLPPLARSERADFAMSMATPGRAVKAEELFDVQQQADFFVSLGQTEQAIEVLRDHISENVQTSALVYLDLFNLYHQLGHEEDYEELRQTFNRLFNSKVPAFQLYKDKDAGAGLETYQIAMSRIEALWPSAKVLEIIEESIFRKPDAGAEAFDLEAYRELLMLYSVAREIIDPEAVSGSPLPKFDLPDSQFDNELRTTKFVSTSIQPLSASVAEPSPAEYTRPFLDSVIPPSSPNLGLDLDLSTLGPEHEEEAPQEESDSKFFEQFAADIAMTPPAPVPVARPEPVVDMDNSIDFDSFDASLEYSDKPKRPKP
ncbi:MAG: hypothetical protein V4573_02255 [Pseudomonadota bacterium]